GAIGTDIGDLGHVLRGSLKVGRRCGAGPITADERTRQRAESAQPCGPRAKSSVGAFSGKNLPSQRRGVESGSPSENATIKKLAGGVRAEPIRDDRFRLVHGR